MFPRAARVVMVGVSFGLVLTLNAMTIWLSVGALALAGVYPFMKRFTHLPGCAGYGVWMVNPDGVCRRKRKFAAELLAAVSG